MRVGYHVRRSDARAPARITGLHDDRVSIVDLTVHALLGRGYEYEGAVSYVPGHGAVEDLPAEVHTLRTEAELQRACSRDADDELVGVRLGRVLEHLVLLGALVGMHLVGDDDVGVERVLTVGRRSQGIDRDIPVSDIARYAVLIVAAYYP